MREGAVQSPLGSARLVCVAGVTLSLLLLRPPTEVTAQFSEPCELTCAAVLGATGFVAATGTAIALGRLTGGMSTVNQGLWVWGGTFGALVGGGIALSGDGERQHRAIYGAGLGALAGAVAGFTIEALRTRGDEPGVLSGTFIGATTGALLGGVYSALTYSDSAQSSVQLFALRLTF